MNDSPSDLIVEASMGRTQGEVLCAGRRYPCALGRSGLGPEKREGDGATPIGAWPLRRLYYRPDRLVTPQCGLPAIALTPEDGWCDAPAHGLYNRHVSLPFEASHERLWREDGLYDLILVPGFNDDPVVPGKGSAIFVHVARQGYEPTEGCVALARRDLMTLLPEFDNRCRLVVRRVG
jgi:L,D-peptidoglycan transpeptidase YkuD (ErfK/YbiS/YcfS/YnhG family)